MRERERERGQERACFVHRNVYACVYDLEIVIVIIPTGKIEIIFAKENR